MENKNKSVILSHAFYSRECFNLPQIFFSKGLQGFYFVKTIRVDNDSKINNNKK